MLYRREGLPIDDELVLCTVTKIFHSSVFVHLDEYDKGGMVHISEIAPGRIRNIREYVTDGKKIVCKILKIDEVRGHIDLSLRRVSEMERKRKLEEIKQEQKAEKVIETVATQLNQPVSQVYDTVTSCVFEHYPYLFQAFKEIAEGIIKPEKLKLPDAIKTVLVPIVIDRFTPQQVELKGVFNLVTYASNGIEIVRNSFAVIESYENATVTYLGGGKYQLKVICDDYKEGESLIKQIEQAVTDYATQQGAKVMFARV